MFNLIQELFSPGQRHEEDEQRRLEHTRVETGSNDPGKGPIDLASGRVVVRPPDGSTDEDTAEDGARQTGATEPQPALRPKDPAAALRYGADPGAVPGPGGPVPGS